jgi:magnesium transporter
LIIDCAQYRDGVRQHEGQLDIEKAASCAREPGSFVWVGAYHPTDDELDKIAKEFGLPELAVEDAGREHQRPKLEAYEDSFFLVVKTARYDEKEERVHFGEVDLFVAESYVISIRHGAAANLAPARERLEGEHTELLKYGAPAVAWAILDEIVDNYEPVVMGIEDDIEEVEQDVFSGGRQSTQRIYFLKREVIEFHRAVAPLLSPLDYLEQGAFPEVKDQLRPFFRDVADHARRVDEIVMAERELLTSILEANLALISVHQNEVVQKISACAAILAVPTFLVGVWGMNFDHMPELRATWGYPAALGFILLSVVLLYRFFKRIEWL